MAVNKVVYGGNTLIDLTEDSVTPQNLMFGATAHDASGESIDGAVVTAEIDDALTTEGAAADAKATGDALALKLDISKIVPITAAEIDALFT